MDEKLRAVVEEFDDHLRATAGVGLSREVRDDLCARLDAHVRARVEEAHDMLLAQYESCRADRDGLLEHLEELRTGERDALLFLGVLVMRLGGDITVTFDELEAVRGRVLNRPVPSDLAKSVRFYITNKERP